jgi:hypothetical protein
MALIPGRASANVVGPCTATLAGVPVTTGHDSAGTAIDTDYRSIIPYDGKATTGKAVSSVRVHVEVLGLDLRTTEGKTKGATWTSVAEVKKYAWAGVGLYRVRGFALGAGGTLCTGTAYVCVKGKSPLLTVAGLLGVALAATAVSLLIKGLMVRRRRTRGELATRFGGAGAVGGIAAAILLQQFCMLPLTRPVAGGVVGGGLLGMALVGAVLAGSRPRLPVLVPPKGREEQGQVFRFDPPTDACNACKSHATHRTYRTREAAEEDRAHLGCHCEIVSRPSQWGEVMAQFPGPRTVYDDRET